MLELENVLGCGNIGERLIDCPEVGSDKGEDGELGAEDDGIEDEGSDERRSRRRGR